ARIARHLEHHVVFEQFHLVLSRKDTGLNHSLIPRHRKARNGSVVAVGNWRGCGSHRRPPRISTAGLYHRPEGYGKAGSPGCLLSPSLNWRTAVTTRPAGR